MRGVNAYIAETERTPSLLPMEFKTLGITPGRWTPAVVISRHQALTANISDEVRAMRALKVMTPAALRDLKYFQGGEPVFTPDAALDPKIFPDNVLELYNAFRSPMEFKPEDVIPEFRGAATAPRRALGDSRHALSDSRLPTPDFRLRRGFGGQARRDRKRTYVNPLDIGSNNWVVSGARTQSTFPILANDPHRAQGAPSLRYWVHLVAPGWNVIGGGEPVLPGVSIGHNEHGAWGLTIFGNDNEDLFVYDVNPANPNEYRYQGRWEAMRVTTDTIPVKGEKPATVELKYTRHGPVIFEDAANHKAYALRAAWMEIGSRALPGQPPHEPGPHVGGVPRGLRLQPHAGGEHGLGGPHRHHRLAGGRHPAAAAELERAAASARRWPLRVGWLPPDHRAPARGEPVARVRGHGESLPLPQ